MISSKTGLFAKRMCKFSSTEKATATKFKAKAKPKQDAKVSRVDDDSDRFEEFYNAVEEAQKQVHSFIVLSNIFVILCWFDRQTQVEV